MKCSPISTIMSHFPIKFANFQREILNFKGIFEIAFDIKISSLALEHFFSNSEFLVEIVKISFVIDEIATISCEFRVSPYSQTQSKVEGRDSCVTRFLA